MNVCWREWANSGLPECPDDCDDTGIDFFIVALLRGEPVALLANRGWWTYGVLEFEPGTCPDMITRWMAVPYPHRPKRARAARVPASLRAVEMDEPAGLLSGNPEGERT